MAKFAYVENNTVIETCDILPTNWRNISNLRNLENYPAELDALGWKTVQKIPVSYNPVTQTIVNYIYTYNNNQVFEETVVEYKPEFSNKPVAPAIMIGPEEGPSMPTPTGEISPPPIPSEVLERENTLYRWNLVRAQRDQFMRDFEWRYTRYYRHERLNLPQIDNIPDMDNYMKALADITLQPDPGNIVWPEYIQTTTSTTTSTTTEAP